MKKLFFCSTLLVFHFSVHAQIKILHKRIDNLPAQSMDFRVGLDTMYKNLVDSGGNSVAAGAKRTTVVLEYGDGSFTDSYNSNHAINAAGQSVFSIVTTYYDTTDKPRISLRPFTSVDPGTETETSASRNIPPGRMIKQTAYSNRTILWDNENRKLKDTFFSVISYKNVPGVIAVYYNEKRDKYFKAINNSIPSTTKMLVPNLNSKTGESNYINLIRKYQNQVVFTSFETLKAGYPQYAAKENHLKYEITREDGYNNVVFIKINKADRMEQNIFFDLLPLDREDDYALSRDSTTTLKTIFFTDSALDANQPPNLLFKSLGVNFTDITGQRIALQARDPNLLISSPGCLAFTSANQNVYYALTFFNDGAGAANEIHVKFNFNSKININTISSIYATLGGYSYSNPFHYIADSHVPPPSSGFYYQTTYCNGKSFLLQPCIELVFKNVLLPGNFQTSLAEQSWKTKGTINFFIKTNEGEFKTNAKAEVYFNRATTPVKAENVLPICTID